MIPVYVTLYSSTGKQQRFISRKNENNNDQRNNEKTGGLHLYPASHKSKQ